METDFELGLVDALAPIRSFALAQGIFHFFESGLYDAISAQPMVLDGAGNALGLHSKQTKALLIYLANEDVVTIEHGVARLSERGIALAPFRPWYQLLIGGYAQTFAQIGDAISTGRYASRDGALVGKGSCGISQYDALPLIERLLARLPRTPETIVDLGCGDGSILKTLVDARPGICGIGVDLGVPPDVADVASRVRLVRQSASAFVRESMPQRAYANTTVYCAAFLLQEILEQEDRHAVLQMVRTILKAGATMLVIEVDHRPGELKDMRSGLALAYYNPYYLLHCLTEQRLETREFWLSLFREAGAAQIVMEEVDHRVDSTGLEFGCLLIPRDETHAETHRDGV